MQVVADRIRIENGKAMAIDSGMNGSSDRFQLRQDDAKESPTGMPASAPFEQHERSNRLDVKLRRELGEHVIALLGDARTEDIVLNPDSSLWVKRMGEGFVRFGHMPPPRAASALGTIAAWRGTVLNHEHPILETELPIDGSRFEGITAPVVREPVFAIRLRPRKIFSLDEYEAGSILTGKDDPLNRHRCGQDFAASVRGLRHAEIIRAAVGERKNILIAGSAGSGKTTLTNGILRELTQLTPHDLVETRAILMDPEEAAGLFETLRRTCRGMRLGWWDQLMRTQNGPIHLHAANMEADAQQAMGIAQSGDMQFALYSSNVICLEEDRDPEQHATYVSSWINVLKQDKNEILRAARDGSRAADFLLALQRDRSMPNAVLNGSSSGVCPVR